MGNTSVNTACRPVFLRRDGAASCCRNSRYEFVCSSIKFGGAMTSLILPKLIRSVVFDGILTSGSIAGLASGSYFYNDTRQVLCPRRKLAARKKTSLKL